MPLKKETLLGEWLKAKAALDDTKAREVALRNQVVQSFSTGEVCEGTETVEIPKRGDLKIVHKLTYNIVKPEKVDGVLQRIEKIEGQVIYERLIQREPKLVLSEYRRLSSQGKRIVDSILDTK